MLDLLQHLATEQVTVDTGPAPELASLVVVKPTVSSWTPLKRTSTTSVSNYDETLTPATGQALFLVFTRWNTGTSISDITLTFTPPGGDPNEIPAVQFGKTGPSGLSLGYGWAVADGLGTAEGTLNVAISRGDAGASIRQTLVLVGHLANTGKDFVGANPAVVTSDVSGTTLDGSITPTNPDSLLLQVMGVGVSDAGPIVEPVGWVSEVEDTATSGNPDGVTVSVASFQATEDTGRLDTTFTTDQAVTNRALLQFELKPGDPATAPIDLDADHPPDPPPSGGGGDPGGVELPTEMDIHNVSGQSEFNAKFRHAGPNHQFVLADGDYDLSDLGNLGESMRSGGPSQPIVIKAANNQGVRVTKIGAITGSNIRLWGLDLSRVGLTSLGSNNWFIRCKLRRSYTVEGPNNMA